MLELGSSLNFPPVGIEKGLICKVTRDFSKVFIILAVVQTKFHMNSIIPHCENVDSVLKRIR